MIQTPQQPETPNIRFLAQRERERFTGLTTAVVTLTNTPAQTIRGTGLDAVFKNGALVDPTTYTVVGNVITLGGALIVGDVVVVFYAYRSGQ